jgi:poly-beta-1,6-N-acetyl-D-glucosamine synthase
MLALEFFFWLSLALVAYVYFGYPAGIWLCAVFSENQRPAQGNSQLPSVTVLIPAYNEEKWIARKIENTLAIDYPRDRFQVLVACDGCSDQTSKIVRQFVSRGVDVDDHGERCGKTATLNRVVPRVRGDIVLLTDANALLQPDALQLLIPHFCDPRVGCVTGQRVCLPTESSASAGEGLYWRYEATIKTAESQLGSCLGGVGQVMAFRRSLFTPIPVIGDDFYIPMNMLITTGARVAFEPRCKAMIPSASSLKLELERKIRSHVSLLRDLPYLRSGLNPLHSKIWWRFLSHHILRLFVPYALLACLVSSVILWRVGPSFKIIALIQGAFYLAALAGYIFESAGKRVRMFYVPFYFLFANSGVLLAWVRWMRGKHQYAWQRTERILPRTDAVTVAKPMVDSNSRLA